MDDPKILEIYESLPKPQKILKGEVLYSKENFSKALGIILKGCAVVTMGNANQTTMRSMAQGSVFGAAALFCDAKDFVSIISAKTDVLVTFIDEEVLNDLFLKHHEIAVKYIHFLSGRVRFLNEKIESFTCKNKADRVWTYLLNIADNDGSLNLKGMSQISRVLGIGRTSLYRAIDELKAKGKLITKDDKIYIKEEKK